MNIILTEQQFLNNILLTEERISSLILEGKDPVELLKYKFKNIPENVIETLVSIDPSKKKGMAQWVCKQWNDEQNYITRCLNNGKLTKLFNYAKDHSDVQLKDIPSVEKGIKMYVGESDDENANTSDSVLSKSSAPTTFVKNLDKDVDSDLANDFDIVFKDGDWIIAVPHTYEASCKLGEGMKWCTANAYGNGKEFYNEYLSKGGQYYINFDLSEGQQGVINKLEYPFTRYQFHFESNQFMDGHNDPVSFDDIDLPESAREFYEEEGYDLDKYGLSDEEKRERYFESRRDDAMSLTDDLMLQQDYNQDYEFEEPNEDTVYLLFDDNDKTDPIDANYEFYKRDDTIQYHNSDNSAFVLKQTNGKYAVVYKGNPNGIRVWTVYQVDTYGTNGDVGVVGINNSDKELFFTDGYGETIIPLDNHKYSSVFVNDHIREDCLFVEAITEDGFHTLAEVSPDEELIIALDIPQNGKYYESDENYHISARYRTYSVNWNGEEDDEQEQYQLVKRLDDTRVLIQFEDDDTYNIFDVQQHKCVSPTNFTRLLFDNQYGYGIEDENDGEEDCFILSYNGQQIGEKYMSVSPILPQNYRFIRCKKDLVQGMPKRTDVIDLKKQQITASCKDIDYSFYLSNENPTILKGLTQNNKLVLFDFTTGQIVLQGYSQYIALPRYRQVFCAKKANGNGSYIVFDSKSFEPIVGHVTRINDAVQMEEPIILEFGQQGCNLLNLETKKLVFPHNYQTIRTDDNMQRYHIYVLTDKNHNLFLYQTKSNKFIINPNGIENYDDWYLASDGNAIIVLNDLSFAFSLEDGKPTYYRERSSGNIQLDERVKNPQVWQALSQITGQDYMSNMVKENVRKTFNETLKKLWKTW